MTTATQQAHTALAADMRRHELGAQAIGVLETLLEWNDIKSPAVADIARRLIADWDRTYDTRSAA